MNPDAPRFVVDTSRGTEPRRGAWPRNAPYKRPSHNRGGVRARPEMWTAPEGGFCPVRLVKMPPEQGFYG